MSLNAREKALIKKYGWIVAILIFLLTGVPLLSMYGTAAVTGARAMYFQRTGIVTSNVQNVEVGTSAWRTESLSGHSFTLYYLWNAEFRCKSSWNVYLASVSWIDMSLTVSMQLSIEVSELGSPEKLGSWEDIMFKKTETDTMTTGDKVSYYIYAYKYRINTRISGDAQLKVNGVKEFEGVPKIGDPWHPWLVEPMRKEQMALEVAKSLIAWYNDYALMKGAEITFMIDAPKTLQGITMSGFIGIMGMWVMDYNVEKSPNDFLNMAPQVEGVSVDLYSDEGLENREWIAPGDYSPEVLGDDFVYYPQNFAAQYGYFKIDVVEAGAKMLYDEGKYYPNYYKWEWEQSGKNFPAVNQGFRVDVVLSKKEPFEIPKYNVPGDITLDVPDEPQNKGTGGSGSSLPYDWTWIAPYLIFGSVAVVIVYKRHRCSEARLPGARRSRCCGA